MARKGSLFAWLICGLGAVFYCYEYLLRIAPNVMTQELMSSFGISAGALGGMIAFYYHAYTPMQLPVGLLMDRYGPRRLLTVAALICALGSYLFIQSTSLGPAEVGRFLVGLGSAFAFVGVLKLGSLWLPANRLALVTGCVMTIAMLGAMIGNNLIQYGVTIVGWRDVIYYLVIAGIVLAAVLWFVIPCEGKGHETAHHTVTFKQLGRELFQLIRNPQIWLVGIVGALLYLSLSAFAELWGVSYLERVYELTHAKATQLNSLVFLGWAVAPPILGLLSDRIEKRRTPLIVCTFIALILSCILVYFPGFGKSWLGILLFLFGAFTSIEILVFPIARELSLPGLAGTAIALMNMVVMIGGNLFQPLIGVFLDVFLGKRGETSVANLQAFSAHDFQMALSILPIGMVICLILLVFIKETHAKPREHMATVDDKKNVPPINCRLTTDIVE